VEKYCRVEQATDDNTRRSISVGYIKKSKVVLMHAMKAYVGNGFVAALMVGFGNRWR